MPQSVDYRTALRSMTRLRRGYDDRIAMEFKEALDGGETRAAFEAFLAEPESDRLIADRPDLPATLDDWDTLAAQPPGTLGLAYRSLAMRDGIRVLDLTNAVRRFCEPESDPQEWFRARMIASHDLLHVLAGYERDQPGELLLLAFTLGFAPKRVLRVSLLLGLAAVPWRCLPSFLRDVRRAWRRGRDSTIPKSVRWEELLTRPMEEARSCLGIASVEATHGGWIWRVEPGSGDWLHAGIPGV